MPSFVLELLHAARDAARQGRRCEAGAILVEAAPDFEYRGRARRKPSSLKTVDAFMRGIYGDAVPDIAMRQHPIFGMLRKEPVGAPAFPRYARTPRLDAEPLRDIFKTPRLDD